MREQFYAEYGILPESTMKFGSYDAFRNGNFIYFMVPAGEWEQDDLNEFQTMGQHMMERGEPMVAYLYPTVKGSPHSRIDGQKWVLFCIPYYGFSTSFNTGKELAKFHHRGRTMPYALTRNNRSGQWKQLWETRLDQMEAFWKEKLREGPQSSFDRAFLESFPYYLGLTENAIQYLVDTELDDYPQGSDMPAICHHRFTDSLWKGNTAAKIPLDWVVDHPGRDLAEWARDVYLKKSPSHMNSIQEFFREYERKSPLSSYSWRLIYARLLLPVHYFEEVEAYYVNDRREEGEANLKKLNEILNKSGEYERFLSQLPELARYNLPRIHWLAVH